MKPETEDQHLGSQDSLVISYLLTSLGHTRGGRYTLSDRLDRQLLVQSDKDGIPSNLNGQVADEWSAVAKSYLSPWIAFRTRTAASKASLTYIGKAEANSRSRSRWCPLCVA